jgi:multidrug resistance efflux pump
MRVGALVLAVAAVVAAGPVVAAQAPNPKGGEAAGREGVKVFNVVEVRTTVVFAKPEGARVEKGELVCELDPTALKDRLAVQETVIRGAEADLEGARLAREVAEIAVEEYVGIYKQDLETAQGEVALADANRKRAEDRLDWSNRMLMKGYVSLSENISEKLELQQANFSFEQAQTKKAVLEKFTKDKTAKTLKSELETARARELAKQAAYEREVAARKALTAQVGRCKVVAPAAGRVRYADLVAEGARVSDGQLLFRVVPEGEPGAK